MKIIATLLIAVAAPTAPARDAQGLEARPATWETGVREGQPILRGASREEPGDRMIFMCNNDHRLVAMLLLLSDDPQTVADGSGTGRWVIDGRFQAEVDTGTVIPMGRHILSMAFVDPELVSRLSAADAAGFAWNNRSGTPFAGFQIDMAGAHALLPAFARQCNAELYR